MLVDPVRYFEIQGRAYKVLSKFAEIVSGATNQTFISGVSGQIIRVVGWTCGSVGAVSGFALKDAAAGSRLHAQGAPANTSDIFFAPIHEAGYFETSSGNALGYDVGGGPNVNLTVFYIQYTG